MSGPRAASHPSRGQGDPLRTPVVFASTYRFSGDPDSGTHMYGRWTNPSWTELEEALGTLEGGQAVSFASGMAAAATALCSVLAKGDTVLLPSDGYYGVRSFAETYLRRWGIEIRYARTEALGAESLSGVRLVWVETPTNPLLDTCDIEEVAASARAQGTLLAVDNTTSTAAGQRPLALGADFSVSSDTKGTGGHSDLVAGHVAAKDAELAEGIRQWRSLSGSVPSPMDAWLLTRSLGTLQLRLERQTSNAHAVAELLAEHPVVTSVRYPGLPDDPSHRIASKQMTAYGGVVSFSVNDRGAAERFLQECASVIVATSFGGIHTTAERRARWGSDDVPEGLIRLSVGCEPIEELRAGISDALDAAAAKTD